MTRSYQHRLYANAPALYRWIQLVMLPFEVLHHQRWGAPWRTAQR